MNRAPFFNEQFFVLDAEGRVVPAASYQLFTWQAGGTTIPQDTYEDQAGGSPNTNPIDLDAEGRCNLWLDPALEYAIELREPVAMGGGQVWVRDDVVGSAETTNTVLSVNSQTGDVTLIADDIEFTSSAGLAWFDATDVGTALDQVAERANAPEAESVTVVDAGGYFPDPSNVEEILQYIGEALGEAAPGRFLRSVVLTAGAIWAVPVDVGSILVKAVGGGGGGAGGYCERHITAPTTPITVTIGAGGAAGAAGGDTIFGTYMTAGGGAAASTAGGSGGTCTGGDINLKGGGGGARAEDAGGDGGFGAGGNSYFGGGGRGTPYPGAAEAGGTNTGGGGSGGQGAGGAGGSGIVVIYQYT